MALYIMKPWYKQQTIGIKPFATATDSELAEMLQAHYDGLIDLHQDGIGWDIGAERTVSLSAMSATEVGESHVAQNVTMVLMNRGGKTLSDGVTDCAFVVGQKNCLLEKGYMHNTEQNGWKNCKRRTWCNSVYYNAFPSGFKALLKEFTNETGCGGGWASLETVYDYCSLPSESGIYGAGYTSSLIEDDRFYYYRTVANWTKTLGDNGSLANWWTRSSAPQNSANFVYIYDENPIEIGAMSNSGLSPFFVI